MGDISKQILLFLATFLVRLPFLFAGYGIEEDSWGHVLHAALLNETGTYEVSRLPGHPLYEALLFVFWNSHSPLLYNIWSALASAGAVVVFYRIARFHKLSQPLLWSVVFCFVPVFFISGTYTIDYTITLFFSLLAYEAALKNNPERAGIWLAVAAGFRITALGFLVPIGYLILRDKSVDTSLALRFRKVFKLVFLSLALGFFFYLPPYFTYGVAFFDFHKPPYPALLEAFYKMSIGVWGLVGMLALTAVAISLIINRKNLVRDYHNAVWLLVLVVFGTAYFRMPEKAAFWLPVVPFVLLFIGRNLKGRAAFATAALLIVSGWIFGINTTDPHTGSQHSSAAIEFNAGGENIFLDPAHGAIMNDYTKRQTKQKAVKKIEARLDKIDKPTLVIAGWWYAMLEVSRRDCTWKNELVQLRYLPPPTELAHWKNQGYDLRSLPKQGEIVDRKYNTNYVATNATLLAIP